MEFKEFVKARKRMCRKYDCDECPLGEMVETHNQYACPRECFEGYDEAEDIVSEWLGKNPFVSNEQKLKEVLQRTFGDDYTEIMISAKPIWANAEYKEPGGKQND